MNVLLTNDDGIHAAGLRALVKAMPSSVQVRVAAPANEKSACSHSISLGQKLRIEEYPLDGSLHYAVHGTPADCIKFTLSELKDFFPDLIISGINHGANTGVSVYYSGTISAAREALINRIPSMAISLAGRPLNDFSVASDVVREWLEAFRNGVIPRGIMLNINVPAIPADQIQGMKITKQADSRFIEEFVPETDHDGKKVYKLAGEIELMDPDGTSDEEAVLNGFISVTPLRLDLTDYNTLASLKNWMSQKMKLFQP